MVSDLATTTMTPLREPSSVLRIARIERTMAGRMTPSVTTSQSLLPQLLQGKLLCFFSFFYFNALFYIQHHKCPIIKLKYVTKLR